MKRGVFILQVKIQPFRSTSEVPTQISGLPTLTENTVHRGQKSARASQCRNSRQMSGLPTVGSFDVHRDFRRVQLKQTVSTSDAGTPGLGQVSVGTPGERRDFRRSELPANVGTSDVHRQRASQKHRCRDSGLSRDFGPSGVPTYIGTSDTESYRK